MVATNEQNAHKLSTKNKRKGEKNMKNFFNILLALLMLVAIAGGAVLLAKTVAKEPVQQEQNSSNQDSNWQDGSESKTPLDGLKVPTNASTLEADGLKMNKDGELYLGDHATRPSLRFTCNLSGTLKAEVDANPNKKIAMLCYPKKIFDLVNVQEHTVMDWVKAFEEAEYTDYIVSEFTENIHAVGSDYYFRFKLMGLPDTSTNLEVVALGMIITTHEDGTKSYQYASFADGETYRSSARSVAYVCAEALNNHTLGTGTMDEAVHARISGYINESVDLANGLKQPTADGSTYEFELAPKGTQTLKVGSSIYLETTITPAFRLPVAYRSTDETVVSVSTDGKVTALKPGTAVIAAYVAGKVKSVTITVTA